MTYITLVKMLRGCRQTKPTVRTRAIDANVRNVTMKNILFALPSFNKKQQ